MAGNELIPGQVVTRQQRVETAQALSGVSGQPVYQFAGRISTTPPDIARRQIDGRQQEILGVAGHLLQALDGTAQPVAIASSMAVWKPHGVPDTDSNFPYPAGIDRRIQGAALIATAAIQVVHTQANPRAAWQKDFSQHGGVQGDEFLTQAVDEVVQCALPYMGDLTGKPMTTNDAFNATHVDPTKKKFRPERPGLNNKLRGAIVAVTSAARDSYLQSQSAQGNL